MASDPKKNEKPDTKPAAVAAKSETKPAPAAAVKKLEVMRPIKLRGQVKTVGSTILASELAAKELEALLADGTLADGDAPIPPSKAEGHVAFARLVSIAQKIGALGRDGATYTFGGRTFAGVAAMRAAVTLDELEAAIVAAAGSEE